MSLKISLLIAFIVLVVYAKAVDNGFVNFDDPLYVTNNSMVQAGFSWEGFKRAWTSTDLASNWHPVTWLSHMIDASLYGLDPFGHHLTNVLWHALNAVVMFLVLNALFAAPAWVGLFTVLWAVHPLRVESVAWVAERKDLLSFFFWMLSIEAYRRYRAGPSVGRYAAVALLMFLGLASKPMVVTLPFVLVLLDIWPLRHIPVDVPPGQFAKAIGRSLLEKLPLIALCLGVSIATLVVQRNSGAVTPADAVSLVNRLSTVAYGYWSYLFNTIWPTYLAAYYPYGFTQMTYDGIIVAVLAITVVTWMIWRARRSEPWLLVGWLWFLGTLVPVIGIIQAGDQAFADRYTYIPHVGLVLILLGALRVAPGDGGRIRRRMLAAFGGLGVVFGLLTLRQIQYWSDSTTLWTRVSDVAPPNYKGLHNLAMSYYELRDFVPATALFLHHVKKNPQDTAAYRGLGASLSRLARHQEANEAFAKALELNDSDSVTYGEYGRALYRQGNFGEAVVMLEKSIALKPAGLRYRFDLALSLLDAGHADKARVAFDEAVAKCPSCVSSLGLDAWKLAVLPDGKRDDVEAVLLGRMIVEATGRTDPWAWDILAAAQAGAGSFAAATSACEAAIALYEKEPSDPRLIEARRRLTLYLGGLPMRVDVDAGA